jgi:hypothetical protein
MQTRYRIAAACCLSLFLPACDGTDPAARPGGCSEALVITGLRLAWENLNHRISFWGVTPVANGCPAASAVDLAYVGGDWTTGGMGTDRAVFGVWGQSVSALHQAAFHEVTVTFDLDPPEWETEIQTRVPLEPAGLAGRDAYAVLVSGLQLETGVPQPDPEYPLPDGNAGYDPSLGFTTRGIALEARDVRVEGDTLVFGARARFALGPSERDNMNAAIPHARVHAIARFLAVGVDGSAPVAARHGYRLSYPTPDLFYEDGGQPQPHADEAQRRLELSLEPGFATLFVGASGWRWDLNPDGANGYYIRELSWRLDLKSADSATGRVVLDVDGYASHTSMVMYDAMVNVFSIDVVVVPLARGQAVPVSAEGTFDVGTSEASLDPVEGTLR